MHYVRLRHHSPTPQGAAVVAVPLSDRHHDGGKNSKVFRRFYKLHRGSGGQSTTHSPPRRWQRLAKPPLLRWCCGIKLVARRGGKRVMKRLEARGGCGDEEVLMVEKSPSLASELFELGFYPLWQSSGLFWIPSQCRYMLASLDGTHRGYRRTWTL
nr:hypothetical protein [Tanacetum cinerariifolium]